MIVTLISNCPTSQIKCVVSEEPFIAEGSASSVSRHLQLSFPQDSSEKKISLCLYSNFYSLAQIPYNNHIIITSLYSLHMYQPMAHSPACHGNHQEPFLQSKRKN